MTAQTEHLLERLQPDSAIDFNDRATLDAVHKIVGCAGVIGFIKLSQSASQFERAARIGAPDAPQLAENLIPTLVATSLELKRRLASARTTLAASLAEPKAIGMA